MRTNARWILGFALCLLPLSLTGCPGGNNNACKDVLCSGHGTCDPVDGEAVCTCEAGYSGALCGDCAAGFQDNDGDGTCLAECGEGGCSNHGTCDDANGTPTCACDTGYAGEACAECATEFQDNDDDGTCLAACAGLQWDCSGHGSCNDSSGQAACACEAGYQDNDANGTCQADCASAGLACGDHGACDDAGGEPVCACDDGWAGADCSDCAEDWQDNDGDGVCEPGCGAGVIDCGDHGFCNDDSGQAACTCLTGHEGDDCSECMDGYQDNDGDGACMPGCDLFGGSCGAHGHCDDSTGEPGCVCDDGHEGDDCSACSAGYQDNDGDGYCHPDCASAALSCGAHGACDDASGLSVCVCDAGYAGDECEACAPGYQDNDGDGLCAADCAHAGLGCDYHAHCEDDSGSAVCICDEGYAGADCSGCDAGYQDLDGDGTCLPTCEQLGWDCSGHGQCDDSDGTAGCACDAAYTGDQCQVCAQGYQDNDSDGTCQADCSNVDLNCPGHGHCDDGSGTAVCVCDLGYAGAGCDQCAAGYQDNDGDGTCSPTCETLGWDCSGHGACEVVDGVAECACEVGYMDDGLGHCLQMGAGEDCQAPLMLDPAAGEGTVSGTTTDAAADDTGSCAGNGPDRVYGFVLAETMRAEFLMTGYDTVLHLRSTCDDPDSEVACNDDTEGRAAKITRILDPGTYFLWADSYSGGGDYDLIYSFRTDPCDPDPCPGTPECQASPDWSDYECYCPAGTLPYGDDCVDDPCDPNECVEAHKNRCVPELPGGYTCECNIGYIPDPNDPDACIMDPDANEWAFIVFLNADNNLEQDGYDDVGEMGQAGSTPYVHIAALFDTYAGPAHIIYVTQGGYDEIEDWGELDMGDWQTLRDFGVWAVQNYPARHYAFIMWDHGDGWKADKPQGFKGFSNDEHGSYDGISISNGDYAAAMQAITDALGAKLDIVGFDACLMGMWEVAEASAPYAHYLVASEETEPLNGWAYHNFLPGLIGDWQMSAEELGIAIVDAYYNETSSDATQSVTNLDTLDSLAATMSDFADALMAHPELYDQIDGLRSDTQSFYTSTHRDIMDFAERVSAMAGVPADLQAAADALVAQLTVTIVYSRAQSGYPGANGLAIYFPSRNSSMDQAYQDAGAVWSQRTTWDDFLLDFAN